MNLPSEFNTQYNVVLTPFVTVSINVEEAIAATENQKNVGSSFGFRPFKNRSTFINVSAIMVSALLELTSFPRSLTAFQ